MTLPSNLSKVSTRTSLESDASKFFNNYLQPNFSISSNLDEATIAFFQRIAQNREAAMILASAVIYTCLAQRLDLASVLDNFRRMNDDDIMKNLAVFLNLNRVGTSLLGLTNSPKAGKYVERMIRV
jgi:hypothetical protein